MQFTQFMLAIYKPKFTIMGSDVGDPGPVQLKKKLFFVVYSAFLLKGIRVYISP